MASERVYDDWPACGATSLYRAWPRFCRARGRDWVKARAICAALPLARYKQFANYQFISLRFRTITVGNLDISKT